MFNSPRRHARRVECRLLNVMLLRESLSHVTRSGGLATFAPTQRIPHIPSHSIMEYHGYNPMLPIGI